MTAALLALLLCQPPAPQRLLDVTSYPTGDYRLTIKADGSVSLVPIVILTPGGSPPVDPRPGPQPPDPTSQLQAKVIAATAAVTDPAKANAKAALAQLYESTGSLPLANAAQLKTATDTLFNALPLHASWRQWKAVVDAEVSSIADIDAAKRAWATITAVLRQ